MADDHRGGSGDEHGAISEREEHDRLERIELSPQPTSNEWIRQHSAGRAESATRTSALRLQRSDRKGDSTRAGADPPDVRRTSARSKMRPSVQPLSSNGFASKAFAKATPRYAASASVSGLGWLIRNADLRNEP